VRRSLYSLLCVVLGFERGCDGMSGILLLNTFLEITLVFIILHILVLSSLCVVVCPHGMAIYVVVLFRRMRVVVEHSFRESMVVVLVLLD